ncbi:hypothetical protein ACM9HF_00200 [Colwellia sp. RE-S-Sl-9]
MDPMLIRGFERILIIFGAIFLCYLGYRLFTYGVAKENINLEIKSTALKVIFSGQGPGLFFMAFGAIIMITSITLGKYKPVESDNKSNNNWNTSWNNNCFSSGSYYASPPSQLDWNENSRFDSFNTPIKNDKETTGTK